MTVPSTFPGLLADLLRRDPGRPLITFYDDATGERVELSVTTYANWVAKTSSLLVEEFDIERGSRVRVDLPAHWLTPVFLGALWNIGACLHNEGDHHDADLAITAPNRIEMYAGGRIPVLATALRPLGVRFAEALPAGVHDFGVEVWSQPDAFIPWDPTDPSDELLPGTPWAGLPLEGQWSGARLLTTVNPVADPAVFLQPVVGGGSVVLWRNPDPERLASLRTAEQVTAEHAPIPPKPA